MKNLLSCVFIVLIFSKISHAQSLLPECEGNNKNILEFSTKHFKKVRKWTDCQGTTVSPRGDRYIGEFKDGKFHGQGIFIGTDGRKYIGEYKKHKKHGHGTYVYANGDKYTGEWSKAKYHGKGIYIYANGKIEKGIWKKGKLVKKKD